MKEYERNVINITTMAEFYAFRDMLNLTDRQKEIFEMKYSRGLLNIEIAKKLVPEVDRDTVSKDLNVIRKKLAAYARAKMEKERLENEKNA